LLENLSSMGKLEESDIRPMDYKTNQTWSRIRKHIKDKDKDKDKDKT
jgi:hypothetical protein